jgi:hypothetical protein
MVMEKEYHQEAAGKRLNRTRARMQPLNAAGLHPIGDEYTRAIAAEALTLERKFKAEG